MLYVDNLRIVLGGTTMIGLLKWLWVAPLALALSFVEGGSPVRIRDSVFAETPVTRRSDTPF